jgi:outer membrane protein TolC
VRTRRLGPALGGAALLTCAGCAVDQAAEVALYRQVLDAAVPRVPDYEPGEALALPRALALANQNNEQLAVRGEDYVQALIQQSRIADSFLPTIAFAPNYTIAERPTGSLALSTSGFRRAGSTVQRFEAPVTGDVNVFRGFGDVASLHAAEAIVGQRRELLLDLQSRVLVDTAQIYYQVLRSERSVEVLRNSLALQVARLSDVEQQLRNGLATRLSVAQTRAQVDGTRATLVQAEGDVANARVALAQLLGVPSVTGALTGGFAVPAERAALEACEQGALEQRQDLHAAAAAVEASRHQVEQAVAQYWPSIDVDVAGYLYREDYADASRWAALLSVHVPIFSAGQIRADVRGAWSRCRQAAMLESAARRQVVRDVRTAHNDLATADRLIRELRDEVAAADDALQQSRAAFANSLATNLDVLSAQDRLLTAQLDLASAEFDETVFYLDLLRAMGTLQQVAVEPASGR